MPDITRVFTELTGINVRIGEFRQENDGSVRALDRLRNGQCQVALGGYANTTRFQEDGLDFSPTLWTDVIRFYDYGRSPPDLARARIGVTPHLEHYFSWNMICDTPPTVYDSRTDLIVALKNRKIDTVVLGDLSLNYQHAVLRDFRFRELDGPTALIRMHLIYSDENPELNRLFDRQHGGHLRSPGAKSPN